ncbi:hypothetical protein jhhlp_002542 [Lomentospora prolificans]|uniref:CSI2 protein n=1 Tax=Lomentospora prolificans TaxID=41688 RepID=A0A2N3NEC5_9PEZI|nr:hypothetical protein jhhlp_002542 [Lomentospora prolificans]
MASSVAMRPWGLENIALLAMLSTVALAQGNGNNNNNDDDKDTTTSANNRPTPTRGNNNDNTDDNNNNRPSSTTSQRQTTRTSESQTTTLPPVTTTVGAVPTLSNDATTPLPTLPGGFTRPTPAVPPTINAPFMQRSTMPDGTVFIAVGAILGAFGLAVLIWRAIVACLLHRSVERAAAAQHLANEKSTYLAPPAAFYKNTERDPSPTAPARGTRRTNRGPIPSATPSQSNLFFSPTAVNTAGMGGNRDSRYLPSGFYAAGSSPSPAMNAHTSGSYTNLRPDSRGGGFSRNTMRDHSPEGSPQFAARPDPSMSSLNLNRPPSQRAPSAYLDDLLDENPHMFPPAQMPPQAARGSHHQNYNRGGH